MQTRHCVYAVMSAKSFEVNKTGCVLPLNLTVVSN